MPFDPTELIDAVQGNLGSVPAAIGAILLLVGPTTAWIVYRMVVQPRTTRSTDGASDLMWVCDKCRSVNEARRGACYRCGVRQSEVGGDLRVIDGSGIVTIGEDGRSTSGTPVGPEPSPASPIIEIPMIVGGAPRRPVAVGPGKRDATPSEGAGFGPAADPDGSETAESASGEPLGERPEARVPIVVPATARSDAGRTVGPKAPRDPGMSGGAPEPKSPAKPKSPDKPKSTAKAKSTAKPKSTSGPGRSRAN
jgi:hypothetical protein